MHTSQNITPPTSKIDKMVDEARMEKALDALDRQLIPNYTAISKEFEIERTTLMRRHKGQTTSRAEATSIHHKLLTDTQEEALISQINKLTARGLPPTTHIVAEEMIGREVNKNWTSGFVKRHSSRLKSLYLRNIDHLRIKSEYGPHIQYFFDLVALLLALFLFYALFHG